MFGNDLEKLLESLFDDDGSTSEDITVLNMGIRLPEISSSCCTYNYAGYNA